ncbi:MAG: thioredoxin family protein, partial [Acidobacteriota bacterium]
EFESGLEERDADRYPEAGKSYHIAAMPTLVILDGKGVERDRVVGMIGAEALAERLATIRSNTAESATSRSPR